MLPERLKRLLPAALPRRTLSAKTPAADVAQGHGGEPAAAECVAGDGVGGAAAMAQMPPEGRRTAAQLSGAAGEAAAAQFLQERGHRVLERNWRAGRDEIDLITVDGPCLVFVEVRARAEGALVGGYHSIDKRKKTALRRVCSAYLKTLRPRPQTYRLDVVQISLGKGGQMEIHHYAGLALFN